MQDPLNVIRRLYGEPGDRAIPSEGVSPDAQAEAEMLSPVKAGLDALPRRRPNAATLDAVFAAAQADALAPVRAVYEEGDAVEGSAEVEAFRALKASLDALPPQRPDAGTLSAVFAAADPLAAIRAVYGEEPQSLDDSEVAALAEVKAGLDSLPPQRPDEATLDAVLAAGASPTSTSSRASDRAPKRLVTRRRMVVALSGAFALVLVMTSGLWLDQRPDLTAAVAEQQAPQEDAVADNLAARSEREQTEQGAADVPENSTETAPATTARSTTPRVQERGAIARVQPTTPQRAAPPAPSASAPDIARAAAVAPNLDADVAAPLAEVADAASAFAGASVEAASDLALVAEEDLALADGDESLRVLYLRMQEMQASQAGMGWDEPPVSLGAAPDSTPATSGWMQVRVDR